MTKENENLFKENSCYASQISSINSQKDDFEKVIVNHLEGGWIGEG